MIVHTNELYRLAQDHDGRWYIIPLQRSTAFTDWLSRPHPIWLDEPPDFAIPVSGPESIVFTYPRERD